MFEMVNEFAFVFFPFVLCGAQAILWYSWDSYKMAMVFSAVAGMGLLNTIVFIIEHVFL